MKKELLKRLTNCHTIAAALAVLAAVCIVMVRIYIFNYTSLAYVWEKCDSSTYNQEIYGEGIVLKEYRGSATHIRVPETIKGMPVRLIDDNCFTANRFLKVSSKKVIEERYAKETKLAKAVVDKLKKECAAAQKDIDTYKAEVGKCLRGDSKWDTDILRELLDEARTKLASKYDELQKAQDRLDDCTQRRKEIQTQYDELVSWSQIYCSSSTEAKKMILSKLIERVEVGKGETMHKYEVNIKFRISYAQFCGLVDDDESASADVVG